MRASHRVKLRPLHSAEDAIVRPRLLARLNHRAPLSLIIAPAGYGKTTLISMWLAQSKIPGAWLSLDEEDNEPLHFLKLVVNAIRTLFPQFGGDILDLLASPFGRPFSELVLLLINELDSLEDEFVIVLDDYHAITHSDIHALLLQVSAHIPHAMHLVIASRHDPPIPWNIRTRSNVCEIRGRDLRFSAQETAEFLGSVLKQPITTEVAKTLTEQSEGWVTSLRLAALHARQHQGVISWLETGSGNRRNLESYFAAEVLGQSPAPVYNFLIRTSILDFLNGSLCDFVLSGSAEKGGGAALLRQMEAQGAFITSVEGEPEWFRCHVLFRRMLQRNLQEHVSAEEISHLYKRASAWYEDKGLLDEALHYALAAQEDFTYALAFVQRHRSELLDALDMNRLERWLRLFPPSVIPAHIDLLLARAWVLHLRFELLDLTDCVQQIEALLTAYPAGIPKPSEWESETAALRCMLLVFTGQFEQALEVGQRALASAPKHALYVRSACFLYTCYALSLTGRTATVYSLLDQVVAESELPRDQTLLHAQQLRHFLQLATADYSAMRAQFPRMLQLATARNNKTSCVWAYHFWGCAAYAQNQLDEAEEQFRAALDLADYAHGMAYTHSAIGLALTLQAQGAPHDAVATMEAAVRRLEKLQFYMALQIAEAFSAELAMRQGRIEDGLRWLATNEPLLIDSAFPLFYVHELAAPRVLLAAGGEANLAAARIKLERLLTSPARRHNTQVQIQASALDAALHEATGDRPQALAALSRALTLAQPGGVLRVFVDLSEWLASLFATFAPDAALAEFTTRVRGAIATQYEFDRRNKPHVMDAEDEATATSDMNGTSPTADETDAKYTPAVRNLHEMLTYREMDVLRLLDLRLTNKEIARQLGISTETVRQHTVNLFRKMGVNNRRQAIVAAHNAGFFADSK